jgi:hypothetical protein
MLKMARVQKTYICGVADTTVWKRKIAQILADGVYGYLKAKGRLRRRSGILGNSQEESEEARRSPEKGRSEVGGAAPQATLGTRTQPRKRR